MAVNIRAARGDRRSVPFANPNASERVLGADEAMVGGANEQSATIEIDPSEFANNPFLANEADEDDDSWSLPEGGKDKGTQQRQEDTEDRPPPRRQSEEPEDEEDDVRLAYDEGEDERRSHRSRRNGARRRAIETRDQTIEQLKAQLDQTNRMVAGLYGGQFTLSARDIDQRLQFNQSALERADIEMARAIKESDGEAFALVQRERDKIYREVWQLQGMRQQLEERARQFQEGGAADPQQREPQLTQQQQEQLAEQNSEFERMRDVFLDRYPWFDPDGEDDEDHRFVKRLDRQLARDGYQPHQRAFWHEMERRMKSAGFSPEGGRNEEREERGRGFNGFNEGGRAMERNGNGSQRRYNGPPTGAVRSTRRPGNQGGYALSEIELDMLRDEGLDGNNLSEADAAKRDRIINKWQRGKAALQGSRR